jgi:predicted nucleotidyltransferase
MTKTLSIHTAYSPAITDARNLDRLYGEEIQFLEASDHDIEFAGAALLGSDARQL